jgi:hypothetical protein
MSFVSTARLVSSNHFLLNQSEVKEQHEMKLFRSTPDDIAYEIQKSVLALVLY